MRPHHFGVFHIMGLRQTEYRNIRLLHQIQARWVLEKMIPLERSIDMLRALDNAADEHEPSDEDLMNAATKIADGLRTRATDTSESRWYQGLWDRFILWSAASWFEKMIHRTTQVSPEKKRRQEERFFTDVCHKEIEQIAERYLSLLMNEACRGFQGRVTLGKDLFPLDHTGILRAYDAESLEDVFGFNFLPSPQALELVGYATQHITEHLARDGECVLAPSLRFRVLDKRTVFEVGPLWLS